jgi:hypothetical protein
MTDTYPGAAVKASEPLVGQSDLQTPYGAVAELLRLVSFDCLGILYDPFMMRFGCWRSARTGRCQDVRSHCALIETVSALKCGATRSR